MGDIYDAASYQPRKSIGSIIGLPNRRRAVARIGEFAARIVEARRAHVCRAVRAVGREIRLIPLH